MTNKTFKSDILESVHTSAAALLKVGVIDKQTMRQFDERCLISVPTLSAEQIKRLRIANKISQPIFARYLNTSTSTVQKWESGAKQPSGIALKLLSIVKKHGLHVLAQKCLGVVPFLLLMTQGLRFATGGLRLTSS